ncbi:hypothetical protein H257_02273 [Aphanomyces astaci]|uniref:Uncharacterized protein n=1 Tax=Aphanomyces astaci TaxID=112090 RepID=W4H0Y6_APHAT|nr:hypothetical protein H257_02273 [Aphanomyces astaci]ETV85660.1 hypothetical protein H257_02273 [Aphanomyces astaci]|eukprot:XP_009824132.1 hypothetical protein H257_02273 [Aphanomyces astaci]
MNDPSFKDKRVEYVVAFGELMGQGKIPNWIDETKLQLVHLPHEGTVPTWDRCRCPRRDAKGEESPNVGRTSTKTQTFGCVKCCVRRLNTLDDSTTLSLLQTMLLVTPEFKSHVVTLLRERLAAFMGPPPDGLTWEEFRMQ